ncbi:MAG TPA: PASTA domain-containing protein, partial [Gemmatimonadales bacterium]|nr:PASTA domain-containing protein [Gemmatimonadales bacterium]
AARRHRRRLRGAPAAGGVSLPLPAAPAEARGPGRRLLRDALLIVGLFVLAYAITYVALRPGPIVAAEHALPRVLELPVEQAEKELAALGFKPRRADQRLHASRGPGTVIWQDPPAGTVLAAGTPVSLTTSAGVEQHIVPDVEQFPGALARAVIEAAGLRVERVDSVSSGAPRGTVLEIRPPAGTGRPVGSGVILVVSAPPPPTWTREASR